MIFRRFPCLLLVQTMAVVGSGAELSTLAAVAAVAAGQIVCGGVLGAACALAAGLRDAPDDPTQVPSPGASRAYLRYSSVVLCVPMNVMVVPPCIHAGCKVSAGGGSVGLRERNYAPSCAWILAVPHYPRACFRLGGFRAVHWVPGPVSACVEHSPLDPRLRLPYRRRQQGYQNPTKQATQLHMLMLPVRLLSCDDGSGGSDSVVVEMHGDDD